MKPWLVVVLAACLPPGYGQTPAPQPQQAPAPRTDPAADAAARQQRAAQQLADKYDALVDRLTAADGIAHDDESAATSYREIAHDGERLVAWFEDAHNTFGRGPSVAYATKHDGAIDEKTLVANLKKVRARAAHRGDEVWMRFAEALERELHAQTPAQRAALIHYGRPQVTQRGKNTCWEFSSDTFCWTKAGELVTHDTDTDGPKVAREDVVPADPQQKAVAPKPAKKSIVYYAAATFASGRCSFGNCITDGWETEAPGGSVRTRCSFGNCATDGWESTHPDGSESRTRCSFGNCFKDGWETTHPDGTTSRTRCSFGDCMKDGWETTMPDGTSSTTRCSFGDCLKDGWETTLPSGTSIRCRCNFGDCVKDGASCS